MCVCVCVCVCVCGTTRLFTSGLASCDSKYHTYLLFSRVLSNVYILLLLSLGKLNL